MSRLEGTKTLQNLMKAFAGESQARNRYAYFASVAAKEGYKQIEAIFLETADNEKEHGKMFYKAMVNDLKAAEPVVIEFSAGYPVAFGSTEQNLRAAAAGEREEWSSLYKDFEGVAKEEGFDDIAHIFHEISEVEEYHEKRYVKLADNVRDDLVFKRPEKVLWHCRNCGYVAESEMAPEACPACRHPRAYFELYVESY